MKKDCFNSMYNIKIAASQKFRVGAKKYPDQSWESVDHLSELRQELLDAYNYLDGLERYNPFPQIESIRDLIVKAYSLSGKLKMNSKAKSNG